MCLSMIDEPVVASCTRSCFRAIIQDFRFQYKSLLAYLPAHPSSITGHEVLLPTPLAGHSSFLCSSRDIPTGLIASVELASSTLSVTKLSRTLLMGVCMYQVLVPNLSNMTLIDVSPKKKLRQSSNCPCSKSHIRVWRPFRHPRGSHDCSQL